MFNILENFCEEEKKLDKLLNRWITKSPVYWSKIDSFCWLYDWSQQNNIEFTDLKKLYVKIPNGLQLSDSNLEYFTNLSNQHGMNIFEDLHILLSSFISTNRAKKHQTKKSERIKIKRKKIRKTSTYVWEFLRNLLLMGDKNSEVIKWTNRSKGVFVIKNPDAIAKLWGKVTKKDKMNYDKMSRSIRYCYCKQYLEHLNENFTFRFGPNSYGW